MLAHQPPHPRHHVQAEQKGEKRGETQPQIQSGQQSGVGGRPHRGSHPVPAQGRNLKVSRL
jgi:hypothetical protein